MTDQIKTAWVFVPPHPADAAPDHHRLTALLSAFENAGHPVHQLEQGFLVNRWGQQHHCPDFAALVAFARQIGASQ